MPFFQVGRCAIALNVRGIVTVLPSEAVSKPTCPALPYLVSGHQGYPPRAPANTVWKPLALFSAPHLHMKKLRPREVAQLGRAWRAPQPRGSLPQGQLPAPPAEGGVWGVKPKKGQNKGLISHTKCVTSTCPSRRDPSKPSQTHFIIEQWLKKARFLDLTQRY